MQSLSIVVPVYNSATTLRQLVERVTGVAAGLGMPFELILVNDGSSDASWETICRLAHEVPTVRGINLSRNSGQHNALLCGIRAARHELIATLDDDLQNPPEELPRLMQVIAEGSDVVYGYPDKEQHGLWRDLASQVTKYILQKAMGVSVARRISAYRVFRSYVRSAFADFRGPSVSIDVLLTWGTTRFAAIPVRHDPRRVGRSNYTFSKLMVHAVNLITGYTTLPLQFASLVGFLFTSLGVLLLCWVIGNYLVGDSSVPGFPFLASVVVTFAGVQLFSIGIIGEYLARMYTRMLDRPAYTVRDVAGQEKG